MRYLVPQFLETEQKIWGPFNFRNFVIMIGVGGVAFILYLYLPFLLWIIFAIILIIGTLILMFYQYQGRPLTVVMIDAMRHLIGSKRYVWVGSKQQESPADMLIEPKLPVKEDEKIKEAREAKEIKQKSQEAIKKMGELSRELDQ